MTVASRHRIDRIELGGRAAYRLEGDGVAATVVPDLGMLCWSLALDGVELLGQPNGLDRFSRDWATTGIPLLHPWANRLAGDTLLGADRATIDPQSPLLPLDGNGLPIHGLNLADAGWTIALAQAGGESATLSARLRFDTPVLLAAFPFPHELTVTAILAGQTLSVTTEVQPVGNRPVPLSFGWHPYFRIPDVPRSRWRVTLPVRRLGRLDHLMVPTGRDVPVSRFAGALGARAFDDLFTELEPDPVFVLEGGDRRIAVAMGPGYPVAQVYAPIERDVVAFEPMTAPGNALVSGHGLRWVRPGGRFAASFAVTVSRRESLAARRGNEVMGPAV